MDAQDPYIKCRSILHITYAPPPVYFKVLIQSSSRCMANCGFAFWNFLELFLLEYFQATVGWIHGRKTHKYRGPTAYKVAHFSGQSKCNLNYSHNMYDKVMHKCSWSTWAVCCQVVHPDRAAACRPVDKTPGDSWLTKDHLQWLTVKSQFQARRHGVIARMTLTDHLFLSFTLWTSSALPVDISTLSEPGVI